MKKRKKFPGKIIMLAVCLAAIASLAACRPAKKSMTLEEACKSDLVKQYEAQLDSYNPELSVSLGHKGEDTLIITIGVKKFKKSELDMPYFQKEMGKITDSYEKLGVELSELINEECGTSITTVSIVFTDNAGERLYSVAATL